MISSPRVDRQLTWLPRITQVKCSYRFCKVFFLFFAGLLVLTFGIAMAAISRDRLLLTLAMTIVSTALVFLVALGVVVSDEVCGKPEEPAALQAEESWGYRIEHVDV